MQTFLPRALAATAVVTALSIGAVLQPMNLTGLTGAPRAERGGQGVEALISSVYAEPDSADVTVIRAPKSGVRPADPGDLLLVAELTDLARTYGSPELVRALEVMRSAREELQTGPRSGPGRGVPEPVGALPPEALLELVVLAENVLQSMAVTPEPEVADFVSGVLPTVVGELETMVVTEPPPPPAEPTATPPAAPDRGEPELDVVEDDDPPGVDVSSQPPTDAEAEPDDESSISGEPQPRESADPDTEDREATSNGPDSERDSAQRSTTSGPSDTSNG
jgi:hypothetical protein